MSSTNKRTVLLVVWLAILGGLIAAITHLNSANISTSESGGKKIETNAADIESHWAEVAAHAVAPPRGAANAPYTLVEFGDFQCPQCGKARPIVESLLAKAPGQVNLIFIHRPFENIHHFAIQAAEASEVAAAQGKFWPMYDTLYRHQTALEPTRYPDYAAEAGLDPKAFITDYNSHKYRPKVTEAQSFSDSLKISATPTLLLRDNRTGKITVYLGIDSTTPDSPKGFLGIKQLAADPPWLAAGKTAQK